MTVTGESPGPVGIRRRSTLLEHRLSDGSTHVDWLLAVASPSAPGDRCVWTWRLGARPDRLEPGCSLSGERIADHRGLYMHHEGPVSPASGVDRGTVRRLAFASAVIESFSESAFTVRVDWRDHDGAGQVLPMLLRVTWVSAPSDDTGRRCVTVTRVDRRTTEFPRKST